MMIEPQRATFPASERLTWAEICSCYPDEWVVLVETEWFDENNFEFGTAVVLGHSNGHNEVLRLTKPLRSDGMGFGIFFTGRARAPVLGLSFR
jgi:hypothetical protein